MTNTQSCPICNLENIPLDKEKCPQCDADLSCFKVLDSLPEEFPPPAIREAAVPVTVAEPAIKIAEYSKAPFIALATIILFMLLILVLTLFQLYRFKQLETKLKDHHADYTSSIASVNDRLKRMVQESGVRSQESGDRIQESGVRIQESEAKSQQPIPTTQELRAKSQQPSPSFWIYDAKETDTLWIIAEKYYGAGYLYPILFAHNPHLSIYNIGKGIRIKILNDKKLARDIYQQNIVKDGNKVYWNYTVTEEDTPQSIAQRFYNTENNANELLNLNPETPLQPGQKLRILMK